MQQFIPDLPVYTIDADYLRPELASIHLLVQNETAAFVDTGTQFSVAKALTCLDQFGLSVEQVKYIILTHIHLDHAGGAAEFMRRCPNATLLVHPRGARHMADPAKLIAGASAVYGAEQFKQMYGDIQPIDNTRIYTPKDDEVLPFGDLALRFIDTPGHASHHHCIIDEANGYVFTGDTVGIAYNALRANDHAFMMPTTTPVQFDPHALHASIDRVMAFKPQVLYCTHYGGVCPTPANIAGLHEQIDDYVMLTEQAAQATDPDKLQEELKDRLFDYLCRRAANELPRISDDTIGKWLRLDADLNAQGLAYWWQHRRKAA